MNTASVRFLLLQLQYQVGRTDTDNKDLRAYSILRHLGMARLRPECSFLLRELKSISRVMTILRLFLLIAVAVIQAVSIEFIQTGVKHSVCP